MLLTTINEDFKNAMKNKDSFKKTTLGMIKSKITELEKSSNKKLTDDDILKVIISYEKSLNQTLNSLSNSKDNELYLNTLKEVEIISKYLPKKMDNNVLWDEVNKVFNTINEDNPSKKIGMVMGYFNKNFKGQFDNKELKEMLESIMV